MCASDTLYASGPARKSDAPHAVCDCPGACAATATAHPRAAAAARSYVADITYVLRTPPGLTRTSAALRARSAAASSTVHRSSPSPPARLASPRIVLASPVSPTVHAHPLPLARISHLVRSLEWLPPSPVRPPSCPYIPRMPVTHVACRLCAIPPRPRVPDLPRLSPPSMRISCPSCTSSIPCRHTRTSPPRATCTRRAEHEGVDAGAGMAGARAPGRERQAQYAECGHEQGRDTRRRGASACTAPDWRPRTRRPGPRHPRARRPRVRRRRSRFRTGSNRVQNLPTPSGPWTEPGGLLAGPGPGSWTEPMVRSNDSGPEPNFGHTRLLHLSSTSGHKLQRALVSEFNFACIFR
ncbi:hypothetical protein OBBRIDRAFT_834822 [Obba rivulosa]|uniref:Uncharacterized protein n=1 Tax=Obba rivulosa TaxID=1052685 RepID=A0A8E2DJT3_9APHY|nr:hypothetical protein OBBRIDRAFT_834822 [Obba rivulosa]